MPFYEIPASSYKIPTYAGIETPFYRVAEDTLLGPAVPVVTDATQTAIAYPHYFGTDFDGTYDSVNTPIMQEQQEAFRQAMANAAAAGNRGDYGLQAGYIWDAYNPGFAVLAQIGMLPRVIGQVISAGRAASRFSDGYLEQFGDTDVWQGAYRGLEGPQETPWRVIEQPRPQPQRNPVDELGSSWVRGYDELTPAPTPPPAPRVNDYWGDALSDFERIAGEGQPAPPAPGPWIDRWGRPR